MSRFVRQEMIRVLNRILPPSATGISQPGDLTDFVTLVQPALPRSMLIDTWGNQLTVGSIGSPSVDAPVVPVGFYWCVPHAHVLKLASTNVHNAGISIVGPTGIGNTVARIPVTGAAADQYPAAYTGEIVWLDRPILIPPGYKLRGFMGQNLPDATLQLQLEWQFLEIKIGDDHPY